MNQSPTLNPKPPTSNNNFTESALATYGIVLAVILAIAAFVVGFNKTNIFVALAFIPMIAYFFHEFSHKLFSKEAHSAQSSHFPLRTFLLQDNLLFRISLSLFIVALIATFTKANFSTNSSSQISQDIISPISSPK